MKIKVRVIPNSKTQSVQERQGVFTVRVKAPPKKGKANQAVEKLLSKQFKAKARIILGLKSRRKVVEIEK